jgi:hypothetical protein
VSRQISSAVVRRWISGIRRIGKLLQHDAIRNLLVQFLGLGNRAFHALRALGQNEFRAENLQQLAPLRAHGFGHGQNQFQTRERRDERQRDAGVAAGRFDQDGVFVDAPDFSASSIIATPMRSLTLESGLKNSSLSSTSATAPCFLAVRLQPHERCVADGFSDVVVDTAHSFVVLFWLFDFTGSGRKR